MKSINIEFVGFTKKNKKELKKLINKDLSKLYKDNVNILKRGIKKWMIF